jgi:hypothetical protein
MYIEDPYILSGRDPYVIDADACVYSPHDLTLYTPAVPALPLLIF